MLTSLALCSCHLEGKLRAFADKVHPETNSAYSLSHSVIVPCFKSSTAALILSSQYYNTHNHENVNIQ